MSERKGIRFVVKKMISGALYELHIGDRKYRIELDIDSGKLVLRDGFRILDEGALRAKGTIGRFASILRDLNDLSREEVKELRKVLLEIRSDALTRLKASQDVAEGRFVPAPELDLPPTIHGAGDIYVDTDGTVYVFEPVVVPGEVQFDSSHIVGKGFILVSAIHRPNGTVQYEEVIPSKNIEVNGKTFILNPVITYPEETILWAERDVLKKVRDGYAVDAKDLFKRIESVLRRYIDEADIYYTIDSLYIMFTYFAKELFDIAPQIAVRGLSEAGKSLKITVMGVLSYHAYLGDTTVAAVRRLVHFYKITPFIDELRKIQNNREWQTFVLLCYNRMTARQVLASREDQKRSMIYNIYTPIIYVDFHDSLERAIESRALPMYISRSRKEHYLVKLFSLRRYVEETKDIRTDLYLFRLQYAKKVLDAMHIVEKLNEEKWKLKARIRDIFYPLLVMAYVVDDMEEGDVTRQVLDFAKHLTEVRAEMEQLTDEAMVIDAIKNLYLKEECSMCERDKDTKRITLCCISFAKIVEEIRQHYLVTDSIRYTREGEVVQKRVSKEAERWNSWRVGRILRNILGPEAHRYIRKHGTYMICIDEELLNSLEDRLYAGILPKPMG